MGELILFSVVVIAIYMTIWYAIAQVKNRNDLADVAWGLGFVTLFYALIIRSDAPSAKMFIGAIMVFAWGSRLALHIYSRHRASDEEDGRYQDMRKSWKYERLQAYVQVFLNQGFFMLLVATPIILLARDQDSSIAWYNVLGIGIWAVGLVFEAVGDYQLKQFIKTKEKGEIMTAGLWKYTRHPNYFGEISLWWGFYLFTLFTPYWYVGIIGPITITFLILGVSGIPMLEKRYEGNKKYQAYKKKTSAFFPLPPKD